MKNKSSRNGFILIRTIRKNLISVKGFTLIELLVVISIIGILAAVITVSFTSAQKQARDVTRKSDLTQYRNSLEMYANKNNGLYPGYNSKRSLSTVLCTPLGLACPSSEDPKNSVDNNLYYYSYISDGTVVTGAAVSTQYVLWAQTMENSTSKWVVCSNGKSGQYNSTPTSGTCPI